MKQLSEKRSGLHELDHSTVVILRVSDDGTGKEVTIGIGSKNVLYLVFTLLLDRRSIDLNGAREKEGHFDYKNFLRASK